MSAVLLVVALSSLGFVALGVVTFALCKKGDVIVSMSIFRKSFELIIDAKDAVPPSPTPTELARSSDKGPPHKTM